jgi:hypothetical protein
MSVDELAQQYDLEIAFDRASNGWLLALQIEDATLDRLAALARVDAADLIALRVPLAAAHCQLAYCPSCLFLNPQDVASPCWKREWIDPATTRCAIHARSLQSLAVSSLRRCGNFDHLLREVRRRERRAPCRFVWNATSLI